MRSAVNGDVVRVLTEGFARLLLLCFARSVQTSLLAEGRGGSSLACNGSLLPLHAGVVAKAHDLTKNYGYCK